jgi:hypothetical protein
MVSATTPGNVNVNGWGTLPANTHKTFINSRHYVEHGIKLPNGTTQLDFPWTAPPTGTGAVRFNIALNTVDGTGSTNDDYVLSTSLTMNQAPLPVTWLYFRGRENNNYNILEWATTNEADNKFFTLEKSEDGQSFYELARVTSKHTPEEEHRYSFIDNSPLPKTYYRIKQTDINGTETYFRTIHITKQGFVRATHSLTGDHVIVNIESAIEKTATATLYNLNGQIVAAEMLQLKTGVNTTRLPRPQTPGLYFLSISDKEHVIYKGKVLVSI